MNKEFIQEVIDTLPPHLARGYMAEYDIIRGETCRCILGHLFIKCGGNEVDIFNRSFWKHYTNENRVIEKLGVTKGDLIGLLTVNDQIASDDVRPKAVKAALQILLDTGTLEDVLPIIQEYDPKGIWNYA